MINTREELLNALAEAAELEHGLLIQYLFAAFSFKRRTDEGITASQQLIMEDWERTILQVAHQEMYHLANVCNLLSAVGGAPRFDRPNFPQPLKKYYPFDFQLERFNDESLYRFIIFELPEGVAPPKKPGSKRLAGLKTIAEFAPDPLVYNHIGELYKRIAEGFASMPEDNLFIGPHNQQDTDAWTLHFSIHTVKDRTSALKAIKEIVEEGEGTTTNRTGSHYDRFLRVRDAFLKEKAIHPNFEPARSVVLNPQTRKHRDAAGDNVTLITNSTTLKLAELFNTTYTTMMSMLIQYYNYGGEDNKQREMLRDSSRRMMSALVRPLAEILTEMPIGESTQDGFAGPGFEIYGPLGLSGNAKVRWTILLERMDQHVQDVDEILQYVSSYPVLRRLEKLRENFLGTMMNLKTVIPNP